MQSFDIVALLAWVYGPQKAQFATTIGTSVYELERNVDEGARPRNSTDGCEAIDRYALMGFRMGRQPYRLDSLHPAAEIVHEYVSRLSELIGRLIVEYASASRIPEVPPPRLAIASECKGKARYRLDGRLDTDAIDVECASRSCKFYCPVQFIELPESYPHAEEIARLWWDAIQDIESHFLKPRNKLPKVILIPMGDLVPEKYRRKR